MLTASWLDMLAPGKEYLDPAYYDKLLRPYVFEGESDLSILAAFLSHLPKVPSSILEIGPGSGRASNVLLSSFPSSNYTGVDLSSRMLSSCKDKFLAQHKRTSWIEEDALHFINRCELQFDLVVSMWSFSHAIHQSIARTGNRSEAYAAVLRLVTRLIAPSGCMFIMHFDSRSPEQEISLKQRKKIFPFLQPGEVSPSEDLFRNLIAEFDNNPLLTTEVHRLRGSSIEFATMEDALEYYMNFHMEGVFNHHVDRDRILTELERDLGRYCGHDGVIRIKPGVVVFTIRKSG